MLTVKPLGQPYPVPLYLHRPDNMGFGGWVYYVAAFAVQFHFIRVGFVITVYSAYPFPWPRNKPRLRNEIRSLSWFPQHGRMAAGYLPRRHIRALILRCLDEDPLRCAGSAWA